MVVVFAVCFCCVLQFRLVVGTRCFLGPDSLLWLRTPINLRIEPACMLYHRDLLYKEVHKAQRMGLVVIVTVAAIQWELGASLTVPITVAFYGAGTTVGHGIMQKLKNTKKSTTLLLER